MDKELVAHFVEHVKLAGGGECDVSSAAVTCQRIKQG